jgi:hypothetical protein
MKKLTVGLKQCFLLISFDLNKHQIEWENKETVIFCYIFDNPHMVNIRLEVGDVAAEAALHCGSTKMMRLRQVAWNSRSCNFI